MGLNKFLTRTALANVGKKILNHVPIIIKNGDILNEYGKLERLPGASTFVQILQDKKKTNKLHLRKITATTATNTQQKHFDIFHTSPKLTFVIHVGQNSISIGYRTVLSSIWNMLLWIFQKAEIARAATPSAISCFWKTHYCKLIPNWTRKIT